MELKKLLSQDFRNHQLFKQAITHRSYAKDHNERLEFLGDIVLGLLMSEYLYHCFDAAQEGQLTRMRARLVRKETLIEIAAELNLKEWLKLGQGEKPDLLSDAILADAMEAIIGALYLHQGLQPTWQFVEQIYAEHLKQLSVDKDFNDAKTRLQEYLQARGYQLPQYEMRKSTQQGFEVVCKVESKETEGEGRTKRDAEQQAAHLMLLELEGEQ